MADARIEHVIQCTDDRFWTVFFDLEYNKELFLRELRFESWKLVSLEDKGDRIERVVDVVPKVGDLPGPLKKLAEGGAGYRERDVFDKKAKRMSLNVEPSVLSGKLTISGTMRTEPVGDDQCRRIYDTSVVAKVFGIGGMIESRILQDVKASYDKAAAFTNRWVKEH
jgi:Protein of unknown function (DUF2505)